MSQLSFIGKTAIITGAGGSLGRAYALDLAKRGCSLLINDVGATLIGTVAHGTTAPSISNAGKFQLLKFLFIF
jgi:NAD(P)-dependent dehydrogenase (short-subunit alcohol dehydrogenase family)